MAFYNNSSSICYLPQPPRVWSRVQNSCSLDTDDNIDGFVKLPYSGQIVPASQLGYQIAMLNKGNVLQYKANSSNLTKAQRYSKIAKGQWVNRNTTWGSQSERGYTNPNAKSLKRSGNVVNIAIDPITGQNLGPTTLPVTCPTPVIPINNVIPNNSQTSENTPPVPPPPPPQPPQPDIIPPVPIVVPPVPIVIQDGGSLICSVQENICTGEVVSTVSQQLCNLTTDSDVPGQIQPLCWNDGTPTWYPRQRLTMTNSTNKWPYSSGGPTSVPLQSAIKPSAPIIDSITNVSGSFTINFTWTQNLLCLPVTSFLVYENGQFAFELPYSNSLTTTTSFLVFSPGVYEYYMYSKNGSILSDQSNIVSVTVII
jgi:hypothetical protein